MAAVEAAAHRADVAVEKARAQRAADFDDYIVQQLLSGRRPRSVAEVLQAARGLPG